MACNASKKPWPDGDEELRKLAAEGRSASDIARVLDRKRNSVIGRCHKAGIKLGKPDKGKAIERPAESGSGHPLIAPAVTADHRRGKQFVPRPTPVERQALRRPVKEELFLLSTASPAAVSISEARKGQCRFPLGDPGTDSFRFCGCKSVRGDYCGEHAKIVFDGPPPKPIKSRRSGNVRAAGGAAIMDRWL